MITLIDLYKGYEGQLGIILTEETIQGVEIFRVRLLDFHFDQILSMMPLGQYDSNNVMYNYFHSEGWHNEKWECTTVQQFTNQLLTVDVPSKYPDVYNALILICESTLENNYRLFIELQ